MNKYQQMLLNKLKNDIQILEERNDPKEIQHFIEAFGLNSVSEHRRNKIIQLYSDKRIPIKYIELVCGVTNVTIGKIARAAGYNRYGV